MTRMNIREQFEYPLPVIKLGQDKLKIKTDRKYRGEIQIHNTGGGILEGRLLSNLKGLGFEPPEFSGNAKITYTLNLTGVKPGDKILSSILVLSNGGEVKLPVEIQIVRPPFMTPENIPITSLEDFLTYSKEHSTTAGLLLPSAEFKNWLMSASYPFMEAYELLTGDPNKERALDNFFIISGLKERTTIVALEDKADFDIRPYETEPIPAALPVRKNIWGHFEGELKVRHGSPWLTLMSSRLTSEDFNENHTALIRYHIEPALLEQPFNRDSIMIGELLEIPVTVKKRPGLAFALSKESYAFQDSGEILVKNLSGKDLILEITPQDDFVRFEGKRYFVSDVAAIPFQTKITGLQAAQLLLKKQPVIQTNIQIKTTVFDKIYKTTLTLYLYQGA